MVKVLILSANPKGTTRLDLTKEINKIEDRITSSRYGSRFEVSQRNHANLEDFHRLILQNNPQVLHFSGHGNEDGTLVFHDLKDKPKSARIEAIANSFKILNNRESLAEKDKIRIVVLNACFSGEQAKAIAKYVDCVVGMRIAVYDDSAIAFSEGFYQGLAFGESVSDSFELAKNQVDILNLKGHDTPKLILKRGVDADKLFMVNRDATDSRSAELDSLAKIMGKLDVIHAQRQPRIRMRGVSKGSTAVRAKKEGNTITIKRGEKVMETIKGDDFERRLGPHNLKLIRMKETSMDNYFEVYSSVYPELSVEADPLKKAKLELRLKQVLKGMCQDWRSIVGFLGSCGYRLDDHYQHAAFLCSEM